MLILTRRVGEVLVIGNDIEIRILSVKGTQVRVGINAPENVSVHREEIYNKIQLENRIKNSLRTEEEIESSGNK